MTEYGTGGTMIKQGREQLGLHQADVATSLKVNQQSVSRWEAGHVRPRRDTALRLAELLGIDPVALLQGWGLDTADIGRSKPVRPLVQRLPLAQISPADFESFARDLVRLLYPGSEVGRYGDQGHAQEGLDIVAKLPNGQIHAYQCKRVVRFGPHMVEAALAAMTPAADKYVLLLSRVASPAARQVAVSHQNAELWDVEDISSRVRYDLDPESAGRLVDTYFPGWKRDFLGIDQGGSWLTVDEFFRAAFKPRAPLSQQWRMVGRQTQIEAAQRALETPHGVVLLAGRGGSGKTRFLRELADRLGPNQTLRFLAPGASFRPDELDRLPPSPVVLVVDDAHDREDLEALTSSVSRSDRDLRLLVATRPYATTRLRHELQIASLAVEESAQVIDLEDLQPDEVEDLARQVFADEGRQPTEALIDAVAHATRDCPLLTVVASRLLARGTGRHDTFALTEPGRSALLGAFRDEIVADAGEPADRTMQQSVLALIALIQPVNVDDPAFRAMAEAVLGAHADVLVRHAWALEESGVLLRRGRLLRVVPDLLADFLIAEACVHPRTGRPTGYADRVFSNANGALAQNLIMNAAKLDWAIASERGLESRVIEDIWDSLTKEFLTLGIVQRVDLLKSLANVSFYQPKRAMELATALVQSPTADAGPSHFLLSQIRFTYDDVLEALGQFLRGAGYHLDHVARVSDLLWDLGKDLPGPLNSKPSHPIRVLQDVASLEAEKPIAYSERVVRCAARWLGDAHVGEYLHSPFDVIEGVLATEGVQTRSREWTVVMRGFAVNPEAARALRDQAADLALKQLVNPDLRVATRAAEFLGKGLHYPQGYFGQEIGAEVRDQWTPHIVRLLGRIAEVARSQSLHPVTRERLRRSARWLAKSGRAEVKQAVRAMNSAVGDEFDVRLTRALAHGWAHASEFDEDKDLDFQARDERWQAFQRDVANELVHRYPDPRDVIGHVADVVGALRTSRDSSGVTPGPFLGILLGASNGIAEEHVRHVLDDPTSPLQPETHLALGALRHRRRDLALAYARRLLDDPADRGLAVHVAAAYSWAARGTALDDDELIVLRELAQHPNENVRFSLAQGLAFASQLSDATRTQLALSIDVGGSSDIADAVAAVFGPHPSASPASLERVDVNTFLDSLLEVPDLAGHNTTSVLVQLSRQQPMAVLRLLERRIERAAVTAGDASYQPLPYRWESGQTFAFRQSPQFEDVMRSVLDWASEPSEGWRKEWWYPHLFSIVAGSYDESALAILEERLQRLDAPSITLASAALREAPNDFVFGRVDWVARLLDVADAGGPDCYARVASDLHASAISGGRSGRPGEPFPEDIRQRDRSYDIAQKLPPGSPAHQFYASLARSAEQHIRWSIERDEEARPW